MGVLFPNHEIFPLTPWHKKKNSVIMIGKDILAPIVAVFLSLFPATACKGAERINFVYSSLSFSLPIESLERFAKGGEFPLPNVSLDEKTVSEIRLLLNQSFPIPQKTLYKLLRTTLAEDLLRQLGKVVSTHPQSNGFYPIRAAILQASSKQEWGLIDILKAFPTEQIYVDLELLAQLKDELFAYFSYNQAVAEAITQVVEREVATTVSPANLSQLPDLRQPGKYQVIQQTVTLQKTQLRLTKEGFVTNYRFPVDFYYPDSPESFPVILISHGFGSVRENFRTLAQHLASHGFLVAVPQHIGSDLQYRQELFKGTLSSALSPVEFLARPTDLSTIIDYLQATQNTGSWQKRANLQQIGVIGDSLGGTTALTIGGAPLDIPRLQTKCTSDNVIVNVALILQCQASFLPPSEYNLADSRVKAVIATHPLISGIFSPDSLAKIQIPVMITAGNFDIITPVVMEQIHPFLWLKTKNKHLIFYNPGTHFSSTKPAPEYALDSLPSFLLPPNRDISSQYFQAIATAFFKAYLTNNPQYLAYLTPHYGKFIENESLGVKQITHLTKEDLISAYGGNLPVPVEEENPVVNFPVNSPKSVGDFVKENGVLKVGYPQNNPPFGYINSQGEWGGFCAFLAERFASYLEKNLPLEFPPKVVFIPTNSTNRFSLIKTGQLHWECGYPLEKDFPADVAFSNSFLVTGNRLIVNKEMASESVTRLINSSKIGVVDGSSSLQFLRLSYPDAQVVTISTDEIAEGLTSKKISVFIGNSILVNETVKRISGEEYQVIPRFPINCDYYAIAMPKYDSQWREISNKFLADLGILKEYFGGENNKMLLEEFNYCVNLNPDNKKNTTKKTGIFPVGK